MRLFRPLLVLLVVACAVSWLKADVARNDLRLWYRQPAAKWTEALPVGSGRLGAMVFGGLAAERIQFNEDTLWRGKPRDYVRAGARDQLPELRRLLFAGRNQEAEKLARETFIGEPKRQMPYQPFGDIRLTFPGHDQASDYERELDLATGTARTRYRLGETTFSREVFASHPDRVIVTHLSADGPGHLSLTVALTSPHPDARIAVLDDHTLVLNGQLPDEGLRYESRLVLRVQGGRVSATPAGIDIQGANDVVLLLVAATSFKTYEDISADPAQRCAEMLAALADRDLTSLQSTQQRDHAALFTRVALALPRTERSDLPTDERLTLVKKGGLAADPALAALHFHYGRYLLIASSRPGTQPANLQGIWNEELNPPWESKFTTNINFEMNYWPAEVTGLSECHEAMFDLIDDVVRSGSRTARNQYGMRGWVLHHNTDLWRGTAPVNNVDGVWTTGGAWVALHLWERYLFTGDRAFLERRAYPVLKEAALFFFDFLVPDPKSGKLVANPSYSPEQGTLTVGATMDHQIIRALLTASAEAARTLGVDAEFVRQADATRAKLAPNFIGKHGQLQEWMEDLDVPNNRHRHMSPLFAMFPGSEITPDAPELWKAAQVLLGWRGDGDTGWSFAWRLPLWARAGNGDVALGQLQGLLSRRTLPNLFDLCGPFQIDGNFGACAGVAEMLVQSHRRADTGAGERRHRVELLPALPSTWTSGRVTGLRARGGIEIVSLDWADGHLRSVELRSASAARLLLAYGGAERDVTLLPGKTLRLGADLR